MAEFDNPDWNLAQAAAWIIYRERELVELLSCPDAHAFGAIALYPSMSPPGRKAIGKLTDLARALRDGRLAAKGFRQKAPDDLEPIPAAEWADLHLRPPFAYDYAERSLADRHERWISIRVSSTDMRQIWRAEHEVSGRSKYDWSAVEHIFRARRMDNPDMSDNELITEIQAEFEQQFSKEPPSRSSLQKHMKTWKT